jgi:hypothetical protein
MRQRVRAIEQATTKLYGVGSLPDWVRGQGRHISSVGDNPNWEDCFPSTWDTDIPTILETNVSGADAYGFVPGICPNGHSWYEKTWDGWTLGNWVAPADNDGNLLFQSGVPNFVLGGTFNGRRRGLYENNGPYSIQSPAANWKYWLMSDPYMDSPPDVDMPPDSTHKEITRRQLWGAERPVGHANDFAVQRVDSGGYADGFDSAIGNVCEAEGPNFQPNVSRRFKGVCQIGTPFPFNVGPPPRAGAQVLLALAKMTFLKLLITTTRIHYRCTADWQVHEGIPQGWTWNTPEISEYEESPPKHEGTVGFAVIGIKRHPLWGQAFDVLTTINPPVSVFMREGESRWVDLTQAVAAVWVNWTGKGYASFALIPYDSTMSYMLTASQSWENSEMLARLWPRINWTAKRSTDPNQVYGAFWVDYEVTTKLIQYTFDEPNQAIQDGPYVSFQLPAGTVDRLLSYADYPSLVP